MKKEFKKGDSLTIISDVEAPYLKEPCERCNQHAVVELKTMTVNGKKYVCDFTYCKCCQTVIFEDNVEQKLADHFA